MPNVYQNALSDNFQRWERRLDHQRWMNHMRDDMQGLEQPFLDPVDTLTGGIMALPRGIGNALADMAIDTGIGFAMDYGMGDATPAVLSGKKGINKLAKNVGKMDGGALAIDRSKTYYKGMYPYDWTKEDRAAGYKGPLIDPSEFNRTTKFPSFDPDDDGVKLAGFFSDSPDVANRFAHGLANPEGAVYPVNLDVGKQLVIDAKGDKAGNIQFGKSGKKFRDAVRSGEYDSILIKNTEDEGDVTVMITPGRVKSIWDK